MWTRRRVHVHRAHAAQEFLSAHLSKAFALAEFLVYREEGQSDSERKHGQKLQSRGLLVEIDIWFFLFLHIFIPKVKTHEVDFITIYLYGSPHQVNAKSKTN